MFIYTSHHKSEHVSHSAAKKWSRGTHCIKQFVERPHPLRMITKCILNICSTLSRVHFIYFTVVRRPFPTSGHKVTFYRTFRACQQGTESPVCSFMKPGSQESRGRRGGPVSAAQLAWAWALLHLLLLWGLEKEQLGDNNASPLGSPADQGAAECKISTGHMVLDKCSKEHQLFKET